MEAQEARLALRRNKTLLLDILCDDPKLIFNKVDELGLITKREYRNLTDINKENVEGHVGKLLDTIYNKGEKTCKVFLHLLQTDSDIISTYPRLNEIQWNDKPSSMKRDPTDPSPTGLDGPVLSCKRKKEDVTDTTDLLVAQYLLTSRPVGIALIINNKIFEKLKHRSGTDKDAVELARTFTRLGFRVVMCEDQKKDQMERTLKSFSSLKSLDELKESNLKEWSDSGQEFTDLSDLPHHGDAFVCCILTHGKREGVCGTDGETIPTRDIITPFNSSNCPTLHTKPKLFFIQACRGSGVQQGVLVNTDDGENVDDQTSYSLPEYADILIAFSTIDQYLSAREKDGTWYIQILCRQLEDGCNRGYDIHTILTCVNDEVCKKEGKLGGGREFKQSPDSMNTLRRQLIFRRI